METIVSIKTFTKDDKVKVIINGKHFLSPKQIESASGIRGQFFALIGSKIETEYYKKDEVISEGKVCTKDDCIIKSFSIELSEKLSNFQMASATGVAMFAN